MSKKPGAAVAAIALACAGSASAAVVWQGPASAIWVQSQTESLADVWPGVVAQLDGGKTYQIHLYGPGLISSGGIVVRHFFHYHEDLIFNGQPVQWGNNGDWDGYYFANRTPGHTVSNGVIAYTSVAPSYSWSAPDYHYEEWNWAEITIDAFYYGRNLDGLYTLDVSVVPEPSTWAMLVAGFGLAGSALRRRRVQAA